MALSRQIEVSRRRRKTGGAALLIQAAHALDDLLLARAPFFALALVHVRARCGQDCIGDEAYVGRGDGALCLGVVQKPGDDAMNPAVLREVEPRGSVVAVLTISRDAGRTDPIPAASYEELSMEPAASA
jgi:hypothetical protein